MLVATPIGNLGDLSPRAVSALEEADVIVCEDTRRTGRLLEHAGVAKRRLIVANEHAEASAAAEVGRLLAAGATVAVVTDAGTPGISDPGARLVRAAIDGDHPVTVVPGPAAAVAAVVVSGLPADRFVMEGFLPRRGHERAERLAALADERRTTVLYEAPHRLARTLADLAATFGPDRPVAVCRELTKLHEEVWRGSLGEAAARAGRGRATRRARDRARRCRGAGPTGRRRRARCAGRPSGRRRRPQDGHRHRDARARALPAQGLRAGPSARRRARIGSEPRHRRDARGE